MTPGAPAADTRGTGRTEDSWAAWRGHFPDLSSVTYLNTSSHGAKSDAVQDALRAYLDSWTVDPPWEAAWRYVVRDVEERFARLIGAAGPDVVMVPTLTDAFHRVMSSLHQSTRGEILLSGREWVSLRHAVAAWPGIAPVVVGPEIHPDDDAWLDRIGDATRLVVVSHVCYQTGYRADLGRIADRAHAVGAKVFVDAFQSAGVVPIDVAATPVDFLAAGALKYLLGVPGAAFLYASPVNATHGASRARAELRTAVGAGRRAEVTGASPGMPFLAGWRGQREPMSPQLDPAPRAARFGSGTWTVPNAFAAGAGLGLIEEAGLARIAERVERIVATFQRELDSYGLPPITPREPAKRGGVVVVPVPGPDALLARLRADSIVASVRGEGLRFSFHAYNTEEEARAVARRLAELTQNRNRHA